MRQGIDVRLRVGVAVLTLAIQLRAVASAQQPAIPDTSNRFLTVGLFIASIEEGARIFTPVRFLPFDHPEAMGHQLPNALQLHGGEDRLLVDLGRPAGLLLGTTLQRYPIEPDTTWPYHPFQRPPVDRFDSLIPLRRPAADSPLPGLRAVAFWNQFPVAFIIDTRGMSLADRHMTRATSSGLDVTRAQVLEALAAASKVGPQRGAWMLVYERP